MDVTVKKDATASIISLMDDMISMDQVVDTTTTRRERLLTKIMDAAESLDLSAESISNMKPLILESRLSVLRTAADLLTAQEKAVMDKVKLKLKDNQAKTEQNIAESVNLFLQNITRQVNTSTNNKIDDEALQSEIESRITEDKLEILNTELRTDPYDVSE